MEGEGRGREREREREREGKQARLRRDTQDCVPPSPLPEAGRRAEQPNGGKGGEGGEGGEGGRERM